MSLKISKPVLLALCLTVVCGQAEAQAPDHYPGYKFEAKKISFLKGYKVTYDKVEWSPGNSHGTRRTLSIRKGKTFILLQIHLTQTKKLSSKDIINHIAFHPKLSVISLYVKNDAKVIGFGDTVYTYHRNSAVKVITSPILFARKNVVIHIDEVSGSKNFDLRPLAEQIDNDIKSQSLVAYKEIKSYLPKIEKLSLQKTFLKGYETTELSIKVVDPKKRSVKRFFECVGEVTEKAGEVYYTAVSGEGERQIRVIVINDHLLTSEKTIKYTVLKEAEKKR